MFPRRAQVNKKFRKLRACAWHLISDVEEMEILTVSRSEAGREGLRLELVRPCRVLAPRLHHPVRDLLHSSRAAPPGVGASPHDLFP
jgi:hypothetical protein